MTVEGKQNLLSPHLIIPQLFNTVLAKIFSFYIAIWKVCSRQNVLSRKYKRKAADVAAPLNKCGLMQKMQNSL